eukprot:GILI01017556.1.p1 GENE.GILI01017556.1~~GILI01017556.1.p1  ORF type:complete len:391 (+),score=83.01 GILI01017556.1:81-1253(+)
MSALINQLADCIDNENGERIVHILRSEQVRGLAQRNSEQQLNNLCLSLPNKYDETVASYLAYLQASMSGRHADAFDRLNKCVDHFRVVFESLSTSWCNPLLHFLVNQLKRAAEKSNSLDVTEATIKKFYRLCPIQDLGNPESKSWGVLQLIVVLFKIYFRINNLKMCEPFIRTIHALSVPIERFPRADAVAAKYYLGRILMYEENFVDAEKHLEWAFAHCHKNSLKNKRSVLQYLVPVKMHLGELPSPALLHKYGLDEFKDIAVAVKQGDVMLFNRSMEQYQDVFIKRGVFLILEGLKTLVYRSLTRKLWGIISQQQTSPTQLKLEQLVGPFAALGVIESEGPEAVQEVECVIANLIYRGLIKGYISLKLHILVLSKDDKFPQPASVLKK